VIDIKPFNIHPCIVVVVIFVVLVVVVVTFVIVITLEPSQQLPKKISDDKVVIDSPTKL